MRPEVQPGKHRSAVQVVLGKALLEQHPDIQEAYFWGGGFWKVGYYVGTTGAVSEEVVERYIEETEHMPE